ncbi:MAG: ATP-binding protein [Colwellia sp.]|nr:ATP-binding protein [Colwellia sp.]
MSISEQSPLRFPPTIRFTALIFFLIFINFNIVSATNYKVELLNAENGFNSSIIFSIVQDEQGFIWFGSGYDGLFRYDGKNIKEFKHDPNNPHSIPHNNTGNLTLDNNNNLWIGSWGGSVIKYDLSLAKFNQYSHNSAQAHSISDPFVQKIFQDNQGDFWMGTFMHGLNKFNKKDSSFTHFPFEVNTGNGTSNARIWDIVQTGKNDLWLATSYGLNHFDKSTSKFRYFYPEPLKAVHSSNKIRKILATDDNRLLLTTDNGVLLFDITAQTFTAIKNSENNNIGQTYSIIKTSFGQYWLTSASGLHAFSLDNFVLEKVELGVYDACSQTVFEDRSGLIWLSCEGVGVYKITPNQNFNLNDSPQFKSIRGIKAASDTSLYIASNDWGIQEWFPKTNVLSSPFLNAKEIPTDKIFRTKEGKMWFRGKEKLYHAEVGGKIKPFTSPIMPVKLPISRDFLTLEQDKLSRLWVGTGKGLFIFEKMNDEYLYIGSETSNNPIFKHPNTTYLYRDLDDRMWVGTADGLYLWSETTKNFRAYSFSIDNGPDAQENFINTLYQDKQKRFWVGTRNGLFLLDDKTGAISDYRVGSADDNVHDIIEDDEQNLWLLTDTGLSQFNPQTGNFQNFDHRDGLSHGRSYFQFAKMSDGTIYFSSRSGLHSFNPKSFNKINLSANTLLINFELLGSPSGKRYFTPNSTAFNLDYDENYIKFEFTTLDHAHGKYINYFYKLEGFDDVWLDNGNNNTAIYTNLDGGRYTFKVRSAYNKNEWYEQNLAVPVNIATPFWLTWWMYAIYVCVALLLIWRYIKRKNERQQLIIEQQQRFVTELEAQVAEKTASIAQESEKLRQANEIKSQFLANMSHEIRTPLNAVIGLSRLASRIESNPVQADYLDKIKDSSESLLFLINDILDLSKIEAHKLSLEYIAFNLDFLIKKTVNICSYNAQEKNLAFIIDIADEVEKELIGDQLRLQQVLINLVSNAIKFTEKGLVFLSVECVSHSEKQTRLQFSITDTGIGMDLSKQSHLFDAFTQSDNSVTKKYGGTGLGLTISKQLIELMNGKISVRSELNKGSVFTFTAEFLLPKNSDSNISKNQPKLSSTLRILVVDSDDIVRDIIHRILNRINIFPDSASNRQEAFDKILGVENQNTPYDLVIWDWKVYQSDAINDIPQGQLDIVANLPHLFMGTSLDKEQSQTLANTLHLKQFVEKPIISSEFIESIIKILSQKPPNELTVPTNTQTSIPQLSSYSVLLVEDNAINQHVAKAFLADTNIQIDCAENGVEAIDKIKNNAYDIILMDIQMPLMDGLTAASVIRNDLLLTELPIIAMTAHAMKGDEEKSRQAGMNMHLTKPISPELLYDMLTKYLKIPNA